MKIAIFVFLFVSSAWASEKYSISIGQDRRETVTLASGEIQKQKVYTFAYQPANGKAFLKVIPRDLFVQQKNEFQNLHRGLHQVRNLAGFACGQFVELRQNSKRSLICLDSALPGDQKALGEWFRQGLNIAQKR
jgi:hypothetical protein